MAGLGPLVGDEKVEEGEYVGDGVTGPMRRSEDASCGSKASASMASRRRGCQSGEMIAKLQRTDNTFVA